MIIAACAVLHNIAIEQNKYFEMEKNFKDFEENIIHEEINKDHGARMPFINYFQNLLNNRNN